MFSEGGGGEEAVRRMYPSLSSDPGHRQPRPGLFSAKNESWLAIIFPPGVKPFAGRSAFRALPSLLGKLSGSTIRRAA